MWTKRRRAMLPRTCARRSPAPPIRRAFRSSTWMDASSRPAPATIWPASSRALTRTWAPMPAPAARPGCPRWWSPRSRSWWGLSPRRLVAPSPRPTSWRPSSRRRCTSTCPRQRGRGRPSRLRGARPSRRKTAMWASTSPSSSSMTRGLRSTRAWANGCARPAVPSAWRSRRPSRSFAVRWPWKRSTQLPCRTPAWGCCSSSRAPTFP